MSTRLTIDEYAMLLAHAARLRSEDPYLKVGAAALSHENRVIATAYNGLKSGKNVAPEFWADREARLPHMIHAEQNLCSLFVRSAARTVAVTTLPCRACAAALLAHDVRRVVYGAPYHRDDAALEVFRFSDVELVHVPAAQLTSAMLGLGAAIRLQLSPQARLSVHATVSSLPGIAVVDSDPDFILVTGPTDDVISDARRVQLADLSLVSDAAVAMLHRQFSHVTSTHTSHVH